MSNYRRAREGSTYFFTVVHCDYVHCNPVKHGLVAAPKDWPWSTFHRFVRKGLYPEEWASPPPELPTGVGLE